MSFAATLNPSWVTAGPWRQWGDWYLPPQNFNPIMLNPYAWYDAHTGGSPSGITDSSLNARAAMTVGAGSNSPLWLPYLGPSVYVPAGAGNGVATNAVALPGVAELDVRGVVRFDDITATEILLTHGSTSAASATFRFSHNNTALRLEVSNGTTFTAFQPSAHGFATGDIKAVRFTYRASDGQVQILHKTTTFATALADMQSNSGWSLVGSSGTVPANYLANFSTLYGFGRYGTTASTPFLGPLLCAQASSTIDGAPDAMTFDAASCTETGYTSPLGNVWSVTRATTGRKTTVQSAAAGSAEALFLPGVDDKLDGPVAAVPPCANAASASMFAVIRPWATQASPKVIATTRSGSGAGVTLRMASATTIVADVSDGTTTNTTPAVAFTPGQRLVVGVHLDAAGTARVSVNNTFGSTVARPASTQAGGVLVCTADSTPANFLDAECRVPWYALDHLASAGEVAQLVAYYGGGL